MSEPTGTAHYLRTESGLLPADLCVYIDVEAASDEWIELVRGMGYRYYRKGKSGEWKPLRAPKVEVKAPEEKLSRNDELRRQRNAQKGRKRGKAKDADFTLIR